MPEEVVAIVAIGVTGVLLFPVVVGLMIRYLKAHGVQTSPGQDNTVVQAQLQQLRDELLQNKEELQRLAERQQFVEALLEKRSDPAALPRS